MRTFIVVEVQVGLNGSVGFLLIFHQIDQEVFIPKDSLLYSSVKSFHLAVIDRLLDVVKAVLNSQSFSSLMKLSCILATIVCLDSLDSETQSGV